MLMFAIKNPLGRAPPCALHKSMRGVIIDTIKTIKCFLFIRLSALIIFISVFYLRWPNCKFNLFSGCHSAIIATAQAITLLCFLVVLIFIKLPL